MRLITDWDIEANFWKINPQFKSIGVFKDLYKKDRSNEKNKSSKTMWAIALYLDYESIYQSLGEKQRKELIAKDFLDDEKLDWKNYSTLIEAYESIIPVAQKQVIQFIKILKQKNEYLNTLNYKDSGKEIEDLLLSNGKLNDELKRLIEAVKQESGEGAIEGGSEESLSEKGEI